MRQGLDNACRQIIALPEDLERTRVQASCAIAAEVEIDFPGFDDRRWRGIAINIVAERLGASA